MVPRKSDEAHVQRFDGFLMVISVVISRGKQIREYWLWLVVHDLSDSLLIAGAIVFLFESRQFRDIIRNGLRF